jgi:ribonucleoside-diphosphate reductase beta chain
VTAAPLLNGVEHAIPLILSLSKGETRATEYSKAATRGNWNEVWDAFDRRVKAKAAAANDGSDGDGSPAEASAKAGPDMFEAAGVAAE